MIESWLAIIIGLIFLVWSADRFVMGASATAHNFGVSPLVIGMIIVGFGTSAPEIFVGAIAAMGGNSSMAVGNALGSNIANIGLVVGLAALISPLTVESNILKREFPLLFVVTAVAYLVMSDNNLSRLDGVALLVGTAAMVGWLFKLSIADKHKDKDPLESEFESELPARISTGRGLLWTLVGLVILVASSHTLVWGAVNVAKAFGVSEFVIGLTIIAIGTSLPEVAVSITAALKKEHDIVIGNIIGSNMFNLLAVLGVASTIQPSTLQPEVLNRDFLVMAVLTVALFVMGYGFTSKGRINRFEASLLLVAYFSYLYWLYTTLN